MVMDQGVDGTHAKVQKLRIERSVKDRSHEYVSATVQPPCSVLKSRNVHRDLPYRLRNYTCPQ